MVNIGRALGWAIFIVASLWWFTEVLNILVLREDEVPVAVITEASETFDLKSLPGAQVEIRRMTYGQHLYRRSIAAKMLILDEKRNEGASGEVKNMQEVVALWEFANLVGKHNLTDKEGKPLNFTDPLDVKRLSSKVGDEINQLIDKLNNFEDIEEGNYQGASAPSTS